MTQKHNPGPWVQDRCERHGDIFISADFVRIAEINDVSDYTFGPSEEQAKANARLIAAAPDLLEALVLLLDQYIEVGESGDCGFWDCDKLDEVITARAAITKATDGTA